MIRKIIDKNSSLLFKHPLLYLLSLILITITTGYYYLTLPTETSLESLIFEDDPDLHFYESFKDQFGENESLVVAFKVQNIFNKRVLKFIEQQTIKLEAIELVDEVISLSNVEYINGSEFDFLVEKLINEIPTTVSGLKELSKKAQGSSLITDSLLSDDSQATLFFIRPISTTKNQAIDEKLVKAVKTIFDEAQSEWPEFKLHYAGGINTRLRMTQSTNKDMLIFMPLTYLLLIFFVSITLRNGWATLIAITNVSLCLIWTLGILNIIGGSMSPMTSILPPLMMALAVSDSIHILVKFFGEERTKQPTTKAIHSALVQLATPCFLTSLTTAIGFLSLSISDIPPIKHFGIASACGMMAEFILSMTVIPLGIYFLQNKKSLREDRKERSHKLHNWLLSFGAWLPKHKKTILRCSYLVILISIILTSFIEVETNLLEYFKRNSQTYIDAQFVDQNLGGTETLEVSIKSKKPDSLLTPSTLKTIEKIENFLEQQDIVTHCTSINDFYREMNKAFHNNDNRWLKIPESRELAAQYLLLYDGSDIENTIDSAHQWTHISARINVHSSKKIKSMLEELEFFLDKQIQDDDIEIRLTGQTFIANKLINFIVDSQVQSLGLALLLIFIVMFKIFKSIKIGLISLIPNILPILLNFAIMVIFGIPLNSATAIIAAVAIGIAVDDTIHFIHAYQTQKEDSASVTTAVQSAITGKGVPIISTSLILAGGFGILLTSSFIPTIQFGLLVSLIMVFAVISDLLVLPCLFLRFDNSR